MATFNSNPAFKQLIEKVNKLQDAYKFVRILQENCEYVHVYMAEDETFNWYISLSGFVKENSGQKYFSIYLWKEAFSCIPNCVGIGGRVANGSEHNLAEFIDKL
jgi:hypothetical protein